LKSPNLHFSKTLTSKLCFTTERLLRNERVGSYGTGVHLVVHHVSQFQHVNNTYRGRLVKTLTCTTIIKEGVTKLWNTGFFCKLVDIIYGCTIKDWRSIFSTELLTGPSQHGFINLADVHTGRYTQRVQYNVHRGSILKEWHILVTY